MIPTAWSDETKERFRKMCVETALSYTVVGAAFGITRNAAIGRARRMGLEDQRPNSRGPKGCKKPRAEHVPQGPRVKQEYHGRRTTPFREPTLKVAHPEPKFDESAPPPECLMVEIYDLTNDNCHWPIGVAFDTTQKFCGNPLTKPRAKNAQPYCPFHTHIGKRR